jgi:hypothetical protein
MSTQLTGIHQAMAFVSYGFVLVQVEVEDLQEGLSLLAA